MLMIIVLCLYYQLFLKSKNVVWLRFASRPTREAATVSIPTCPPKLVSKLSIFLIKDPLLPLFYSYLSWRSQRVVVNGTFSRWANVGSGVPQWSELGPILFILFVNGMPYVVTRTTLAMFADGSTC